MEQHTYVLAGARQPWAALCLLGLFALWPQPADARQASSRIGCTESALQNAIARANGAGGGTITFSCSNTTIPMKFGLGPIKDNVVIDGEQRNITIAYPGPFAGCSTGNNGVGGAAIARLAGRNNIIRNLTFKHFLESLQISGPNNTVAGNTFLAHVCSDDAVSTTAVQSLNAVIRNNRFQGYRDKAYQMSYGSGTIEGNTFIDTLQPIRGPYDNAKGGLFVIRKNVMKTTSSRKACTGVTIDGNYRLLFEGNTLECFRGLRLSGKTQATVRNNVINGNPRQGVLIGGSAVVSMAGNTITNNGKTPGSEPAGGVVVWQNGRLDLGGGSLAIEGKSVKSGGRNNLKNNGVADVRNMRSGYTVMAEGNCWDHKVKDEITSLDRKGAVDVDPFQSTCGAVAADEIASTPDPSVPDPSTPDPLTPGQPAPAPAPEPEPASAPQPHETCSSGADGDENCTVPLEDASAPRGLTRKVTGSTVLLNWRSPIAGDPPTGYVVDAGLEPGQTAFSFAIGEATSVRVPDVAPGKYYVRVRALNAAGGSGPSNEVPITVGCSGVPSAPRALAAKTDGNRAAFTWVDDDGCGDTSFRVSVGSSAGAADLVDAPVETTEFAASAPPGTYFVRVAKTSPLGQSPASDEVAVTIASNTCEPPRVPTALEMQASGGQVTAHWRPTDVAAAIAADDLSPIAYVMEVGSTAGSADLGTYAMGRGMTLSTAVPPGTYAVRIRPANACGLGAPSNEVTLRVQ